MERADIVKILVPILWSWRVGSRKQCEQIIESMLDELKLRGVYVK